MATLVAGDMPVALMFDGPSLGGFVCPATITSSQIWKMGQVSANDTIRFKQLTLGEPLHLAKPPTPASEPLHRRPHQERRLQGERELLSSCQAPCQP